MRIKLILVVLILITPIVMAQSGGDFLIKKSTIDSGGGIADGGSFKITGSIGQPNAARQIGGGSFKLSGGFWAAGVRPTAIFKNGFE